jgi:hypothetical protein
MADIETITNNLADGYDKLEPETFQEASEVQIQRRTNDSLRNRWVYTANLPLFRMNNDTLEYGLSGRQTFDAIAGADIQDFAAKILKNGVYRLTSSQTEQLEELAADIVWAKADDLGLQGDTDEWSYFLIDTSDLNAERLNDSQRLFAVKTHGSLDSKYDPKQQTHDYGETMKMLQRRISQTRLWLPTQNHIKAYVKDGNVVARASRLYGFDGSSYFNADYRSVGSLGALRGVPKIREADAPNLVTLPEAEMYQVLGRYLGPVSLEQAQKEMQKLYK